jgi:hypothetical protein
MMPRCNAAPRHFVESDETKSTSALIRLNNQNKTTAMNIKSLRTITARTLSILALSLTLAASPPALADDGNAGNPRILPHHSNIYSLYQARWWQWATSLPADHNPLFGTTDGTAGQSGPVWYLGGVFGTGPAERTLTVPAGKALFFPVLNLAYFLTDPGDTEEFSRFLINTIMDHVVSSFVEIDGRPVANLGRYRTHSQLFDVGPLPADNILGVDEGSIIQTVDDGLYLLLLPLTPGEHTIRFGGHVLVPADVPFVGGFENIQDTTYHITVAPRR